MHGMNRTFDKALAFILEAEGGYVNDPADRGGETKFGISKKAYPDINIAELELVDAEVIYHTDYWMKCQCNALPDQFAIAVFGSAVNHGTRRAIKLLQQTLQVEVDGIIGQQTLAAAKAQNNRYMLERFLSFRSRYYFDIVFKNQSQYRFLRGWLRRLFKLQNFILEVTDAP